MVGRSLLWKAVYIYLCALVAVEARDPVVRSAWEEEPVSMALDRAPLLDDDAGANDTGIMNVAAEARLMDSALEVANGLKGIDYLILTIAERCTTLLVGIATWAFTIMVGDFAGGLAIGVAGATVTGLQDSVPARRVPASPLSKSQHGEPFSDIHRRSSRP